MKVAPPLISCFMLERYATPTRTLGFTDARLISAHTGEGIEALIEELWACMTRHTAEAGHDG